jgi:hypothetical protein
MDPATESHAEEGTDANRSEHSEEVQHRLSKIVEKLESNENIDKLARIMEDEWTTPDTDGDTPDLSFKRFEEKLKSSRNQ